MRHFRTAALADTLGHRAPLLIYARSSLSCSARTRLQPVRQDRRTFHVSRRRPVVKPFLLADIGEGIREVQIIQWFVQPGAHVEEFQPLCEVQSDKASTEITSRFNGVIKKLHHEADDMAKVGEPLVDIDIEGEIKPEVAALTGDTGGEGEVAGAEVEASKQEAAKESHNVKEGHESYAEKAQEEDTKPAQGGHGKHKALATPAVRHLTKELGIDILSVRGTGKEGRVLKEDVQRHHQQASSSKSPAASTEKSSAAPTRTVPLTPMQATMLRTMTRSLTIPHFLYSDTVTTDALTALRRTLNAQNPDSRVSALAFIIKAVSLALADFPILNARLDVSADKPSLHYRQAHNIGIAVDTPAGLLVPVVHDVQSRSVLAIAAEVRRLADAGRAGKLTSAELAGGTFTVSNVGSIGGGVVSPVIVEGQMGIVGVGRGRVVPAFDENDELVKREECVLSWSADHRVVDGATVARAAAAVKVFLESPGVMAARMV